MAERCVIIKLARPTYRAGWEESLQQYIEANRWGIIGDIVRELQQ